jgi:hypothetical protein
MLTNITFSHRQLPKAPYNLCYETSTKDDMGKEKITPEKGLCSPTNKYLSGHRIAWIYTTSFGNATQAVVCDIHK